MTTEPTPAPIAEARVLAALAVLRWPDDRADPYAKGAMYRHAEAVIRAADAAQKPSVAEDALVDAAVQAEHQRIRVALIPVLLDVARCIPDGRIQSGCHVYDGQTVRQWLKDAFNNAVPADTSAPDVPTPAGNVEAELARVAAETGEPIEIVRELHEAMLACDDEGRIERSLEEQYNAAPEVTR